MKRIKIVIYYMRLLYRLVKWKWFRHCCWGLCITCKYKQVCLPELEEILKKPP